MPSAPSASPENCTWRRRTTPIRGPDVIKFLEQLLREIPGKLLVIWDGAPIHRSRAVKEWLSQGASRGIQLEQLPGYAPELNPDEGVWRYLKRVELKNLVCAGLEQLILRVLGCGPAAAGQAGGAPRLHQGSGLCLVSYARISNM